MYPQLLHIESTMQDSYVQWQQIKFVTGSKIIICNTSQALYMAAVSRCFNWYRILRISKSLKEKFG